VRLRPGLTRSIVVGAIVCGIVGYAASRFILFGVWHKAVAILYAPLAEFTFERYESARCTEAPATWALQLSYGARVYAYDPATGASLNREAPPLRRDLWDEIAHGAEPPVTVDFGLWRPQGGAMVLRGAASGPCAIVQATWPHQPIENAAIRSVTVGALAVVAIAAALAFVLVVMPLLSRIERLRIAAERVGDPARYQAAGKRSRDELGQLWTALDRAHARIREDAARLDQRRLDLQRHLADVAHDLKTPISSLHLALEQAANENRDPDVAGLVSRALDDTVYLAALTSNLRLASEIREGWDPAASDTRVDLTEMVDRVVGRARFFAKRKGIGLEAAVPDGPTVARCDPVAAEQAVSNVIENAVTHGDRGGHVAVLLHAAGGSFALTVADDGPGVPPAVLPRLGERTFRSDEARERDPRGSGLGLAITSEVCSRCGWKLSFDAEQPRGLRVTIAGPVVARAATS
jgi:signal transduction histidine kinase